MTKDRHIKYDTYFGIDICYDTLMKSWISINGDAQPTKKLLKDYIKAKYRNSHYNL